MSVRILNLHGHWELDESAFEKIDLLAWIEDDLQWIAQLSLRICQCLSIRVGMAGTSQYVEITSLAAKYATFPN